jgi:hypothetical protein
MFDCKNYSEKLNKMVAPEDLVKSAILLENAVQLRMIIQEGSEVPQTSNMLYKSTKNTKKHMKNPWDVDIKATGPGYFDEAGNFILSKPKGITASWLLKRNNSLEGPFTDKEFRDVINTISHANCMVKRDFDKGFVPLSKLIEEVPNLNFKEVNKFFAKNQIIDEVKKNDEFFGSAIVNEKNTKLTNFLKNHEISASIDFIIKSVRNMRKVDAVESLKDITGLDKGVNTALLDLIIEEIDEQILCDVDKDGFYIGNNKKDNRRK